MEHNNLIENMMVYAYASAWTEIAFDPVPGAKPGVNRE
jgi:hypothetical protein